MLLRRVLILLEVVGTTEWRRSRIVYRTQYARPIGVETEVRTGLDLEMRIVH